MEFRQGALEELAMNPAFWKYKKVLITGHTGFKGSWLSLWLQQLDAKVIGYALPPPTQPSLFALANVAQNMTSIHGDVRDYEAVKSTLAEHRPEIVIHMAAQPLVRYSYEHPLETYATNVMGTAHVLEAVRQTKSVKAVIVVTSDKCYQNNEWDWGYRENDALGGHDPYSNSKACAELVTAAYRSSYFNSAWAQTTCPPYLNAHHSAALASVRAGNVIGGGDWAQDRLVPDVMNALMERRTPMIRNPAAVRPWQHVLEPLHGYLMLAERLWEEGAAFAEAWNFGPDAEAARPVAWIVQKLAEMWGSSYKYTTEAAAQPHETHSLYLDYSKARNRLDWAPHLTLVTALEWVVEWHRAYVRKADMRAVAITQIVRYQNMTSSSWTQIAAIAGQR